MSDTRVYEPQIRARLGTAAQGLREEWAADPAQKAVVFSQFTGMLNIVQTAIRVHPTPFTVHPAPYTLHPTPYTLHPTVGICLGPYGGPSGGGGFL